MIIPNILPELLLPAGGFDSAIAAIEGGADALYLGFADFSARKQAKNFDRIEYRRLYRLARDRGVKLYAALNIVILEDELAEAARLLAFLGRFPPDAVIVQDWGLARLIKDRHPGIAIHASTQTAVQGSAAARVARELGASRIVLPRETSLAEMARLCAADPDLEYETFVHGALCYSFSGLCLASGLVLGRSGNRGECAQLCRSYYAVESGGLSGRIGYWFSCRDLDLSDRVGELAAAGISSLKVEGRMKSPEYCFAVASLYRGILDRLAGQGPGDEELAARREAARIAFARSPTEAWIDERGGASLIDPAYPGHRGMLAGRIVSNDRGHLVLDLEGPLGLRDGLLGFDRGDPSRPVRFAVVELRDARSGREILRARAGTRVEMLAESDRQPCGELRPGDELRRISARELDRKSPSLEEYEAARETLSIRLGFNSVGIEAEFDLPRFDGKVAKPGSSQGGIPDIEKKARIEPNGALPMDISKSVGGLERALSLFGESGQADFLLIPELDPGARVELAPGPDGLSRSCAVSDLFVPPSALKREKNRIYARAADLIAEAELDYARDSLAAGEPGPAASTQGAPTVTPPRAALVFPREGLPKGIPFASPRDLAGTTPLPSWGGRSWLPLSPLVADRKGYVLLVIERVRSLLNSGGDIVIGLGALHHFAIARELRVLFPDAGARLGFFLDINLYIANYFAYASLASLVAGVEFAYRYLELECKAEGETFLAPVGPAFEPPFFQSLGCFIKHHIAKGACPSPCGRAWSAELSDRDRRYLVIVEDCVTTLFRVEGGKKVGS
ncbi:MAG: peptidase U32 family protein [Rectinemataceae bacterium]